MRIVPVRIRKSPKRSIAPSPTYWRGHGQLHAVHAIRHRAGDRGYHDGRNQIAKSDDPDPERRVRHSHAIQSVAIRCTHEPVQQTTLPGIKDPRVTLRQDAANRREAGHLLIRRQDQRTLGGGATELSGNGAPVPELRSHSAIVWS